MCVLLISEKESGRTIIYFIDAVKKIKSKKNKINMRPSVSADFPLLLNKEAEHQHTISGNLFFKVIENAGGVPYQLVFGQMPGEGHYRHAGENINQLFGISTLHFTEKLFIDLIEEYIPVGKTFMEIILKSGKGY